VTEPDDQALLARAKEGDAAALDGLVRRYQPRIYRFGMKMCRDPAAAEDVVQDTLLAMVRTLRGFRGEASVSTWLYTIARSFCIKSRRRPRSAPVAELSLESDRPAAAAAMADSSPAPDRLVEDHETRSALDAALASLSVPHREVIVLRDVEGLSAGEVAEVTGLSVDAVKSRLHRARAVLRARLAPVLGAPPAARPAAAGCPDIVSLFSRHLEGTIDGAVCAEMERHIAACDACRSACDSLKATLQVCRSAPAPEVPARLQESVRHAIRDLLLRR
jgi:RNA polymerase sigma-70 factor (ECF subfamily)